MQHALTMQELAAIQGGDVVGFIDGACATATAPSAVGAVLKLSVTGAVIGAFCAGWGIGRLFD
jgi:hypothetical protein